MKNRKIMLAGLGIGVSSIVLLTSAYTVMADTSSGYELYKSAMKHTHTAASITADVGVSLKDNGTELLSVKGTVKNEDAAERSSGSMNIAANGNAHAVQFFRQADQVVVKTDDSDAYKVIKPDENARSKWKQHQSGKEEGQHPGAEKVLDALMTNLQNDIQVKEMSGGSKEVSLRLSQHEISPVVQALGSVMLQNAAEHQDMSVHQKQTENEHQMPPFVKDVKPNLPKLTQDIVVKQVEVTADISADNYVEKQAATVTISGKDASGATHEVVLTVQADLSHFADTKADTVDLTGKQVEMLQER